MNLTNHQRRAVCAGLNLFALHCQGLRNHYSQRDEAKAEYFHQVIQDALALIDQIQAELLSEEADAERARSEVEG